MTRAQPSSSPQRARHVEQVCELNVVRVLFETQGARDAALYATDHGDLLELQRLATSCEAEAGRRFHVLLAAAGGNRTMANLLDDVLARLTELVGEEACCGEPATASAAHQALLDAVMSGQERRAVDLAKAHVCATQLARLRLLAARDECRPTLVAI